jgi:hypothetical protein
MAKKKPIQLATSISAVCCEHGNVYVRLHGKDGKIFAAATMPAITALDLNQQILDSIDEWRNGQGVTGCSH